jgi:peptidoglycan/LPS O-acetylase OafA/YrhL
LVIAEPQSAQTGRDGPRLGHRKALDGVRGLAVLAVVAFHARIPGARGGSAGVLVFFVLSGFLITTLIVEEHRAMGELNLRRFYARRALRLWPALAVLLLVSLAGDSLFLTGVSRHRLLVEVASSAGYVMNWVLATKSAFPASTSYLGHTWSLSVEEQFYLVWPLLCLLLLRARWTWRTKITVVAGGAVLSSGWRAVLEHSHHMTHAAYGLDTNATSLLAGCALGLAFAGGMSLAVNRWFVWSALAFVAAVCVRGDLLPLHFGLLEAGVTIATVILVAHLLATASPLAPVLEWAPLVYVGKISYGLYLWHFAVFAVINSGHFPQWSAPELLAAKLTISFALAITSYYLVERPFLKLKGRYASSKQAGAVDDSAAPVPKVPTLAAS